MAGTWRKVRTNAELAKVLEAGDYADIVGTGFFDVGGSATVRASGSATVSASGSATVRASGSATVSAYGSATVIAYGSATVRAYGSATVRASGSATVRASGSATVSASGYVAVHRLSMRSTITGGVVITPPDLTDAKNWCEFYGVEVNRGYATLYKAVRDDYVSRNGFAYTPGAKLSAPDWRADNDCGGGLHFSPRAFMALAYHEGPRFVACKVKVADLVVIGDAGSADKVKAPACSVLYECDQDGNKISGQASDAA